VQKAAGWLLRIVTLCDSLIERASRRHLANAISWSAHASLFTFPRHTGDKVSIRVVMYITDKFPYTELELGFAGRVATDVASSRIAFLCGG
jgi:hypothetical protein